MLKPGAAMIAGMVLLLGLAGCGANVSETPTPNPTIREMSPEAVEACTQAPGEADWDALTKCRDMVNH